MSSRIESIPKLGKKEYARELRRLQIELVKLHRHVIARGRKVLVILEGRDAAGKDGTIKRIAAHLSPREVRIVAPGKPSDREQTEWYFQRYVRHLPAAQEIVLFNRSWYNRAALRAHAGSLRDLGPQVLSGHQPQGTGAPLARATPRSTQAVEDQPG